LNTLTFI